MTPLIPLLLAAGVVPGMAAPADCHQLDSVSVLARDLAPLVPGFAQVPGDFLVGYIESSGAPKILHGADLEHIAKNRGVDLHGLEDLCLERRTFVVPAALIVDAMRKTLGSAPGLKIEIAASSPQAVPTGEVVFPRSGVQASVGVQAPAGTQASGSSEVMWHGLVQTSAPPTSSSQTGKGPTYPIWARVRVSVPVSRVIAVVDLPPGKPVQSNQIRVESSEESPFDDGFIRAAEETVGLLPKASIQKGSAIRKSQVAAPVDVTRGETVRVEVLTGNARLSMEARAETSGMKGATVTVRNMSSGRDFQARVTGKGQVTVGGQVE
jgi:flagella basal body P-ring formation protein FlgA